MLSFQVLAGTPAGSPTAHSNSCKLAFSLATVAVGAAVTQINSGNITDTRTQTNNQFTSWRYNSRCKEQAQLSGGASGTGPIPIVSLANTAVAAGTYTTANITVDAQGRITSASTGVAASDPTPTVFLLMGA
jgi:hypothetical protein